MKNKPWLQSYPSYVSEEIDKNLKPLSLLMEEAYQQFAEKKAFECMGTSISFQKLKTLSEALGNFFINDLSLPKGSKIAIMMPNILQYPVTLHAAIRSGLIVVNVNPLYTPRELAHQLSDAGVETIIILENFAHVLQEVVDKVPVKNIIIATMGDLLNFPKKQLVNFVVKHIKKLVPSYSFPEKKLFSFNKALALGKDQDFTPRHPSLDDIAFLQYTGGTTGLSKGAILTHQNISANISQAKMWLGNQIHLGKEVVITALPLYHIFSLTANCLTFMTVGGNNVLIPNPRDIPGFVKTLKSTPFTVMTGVNTLFNRLLNDPEFRKIDFSHLRFVLGGAMAIQESVAKSWEELTKKPLLEAYGLTESSPAVCISPLDLKHFNGSIGLPISSTLVSIRDSNNKEVPLGDSGELCVKGPQVMRGYWNSEEETKNAFSEDGWLKTGDIATFDEKGFVRIVDRKKDMIIVSGFNVYPNEIDQVLSAMPGVVEAAAIGVKSEKTGEAVKAFVVRKDTSMSEADVISYCRKNLTAYKVPSFVEFKEDLPKTNVGKILRRALRDS